MAWFYLGAIACWTLACAALLAAFSTFEMAWAALLLGGACVTAGWLTAAVVLTLRRRWSRGLLLGFGAWPLAAAIVGALYLTDLPMKLRVVVSERALAEFVESGRSQGRAGLVIVFERTEADGCIFLRAGSSFDGIAGLVRVPADSGPPQHPDWALTHARHVTGPWWYFETRT